MFLLHGRTDFGARRWNDGLRYFRAVLLVSGDRQQTVYRANERADVTGVIIASILYNCEGIFWDLMSADDQSRHAALDLEKLDTS